MRASLRTGVPRHQRQSRIGQTGLLPPFLYIALHELLGVRLEHGVDLVEEVVELLLQFLALLGGRGDLGGLLDALLGRRLLLALTLRHSTRSSYPCSRSTSSAGVPTSSNNGCTCAFVPLSGSIIGMRRNGSEPTSRIRLSQLAATTASGQRARQPPRNQARVVAGATVIAVCTSASSTSRSTLPARTSFSYRERSGRTSWYWRSSSDSLGSDHSSASRSM